VGFEWQPQKVRLPAIDVAEGHRFFLALNESSPIAGTSRNFATEKSAEQSSFGRFEHRDDVFVAEVVTGARSVWHSGLVGDVGGQPIGMLAGSSLK
jgi:hypothetical protein